MKATTIVEYGTYHPNHPNHITWHESEYEARDYAQLTKHKLVTRTKTIRPTLDSNIVEKVTTTHQDGHITQEGHTMYININTTDNQQPDQPQDRIHVSYDNNSEDIYTGHNLHAGINIDGTLEITENNTTALAQYAPGKWNRWRRTNNKGQN